MPNVSEASIRVLIADDHAIVREGVRHVLLADAGFEVVGEAADGDEAVAIAESVRPDVVLLDLSMPGLSGLEAAARLRERVPDTRVLVLSIHDHKQYVLESIRVGAQGYLRKDSSPEELRHAIRTVYAGDSFFSAPVARALSVAIRQEQAEKEKQARIESLTSRERDVLVAIARGQTNKEIAQSLGISVRTVESHREAMMRKLGLRGAASLTRFALAAGLLTADPAP